RREQAEEIARLPFEHQCLARLAVLPAADAHYLPQLGIGEVGEEGQAAQDIEFLAVGKIFLLLRRLFAADDARQIAGELVPLLEALLQLLLHSLAHDLAPPGP